MNGNDIIKALEYRLKIGGGTRIDKEVFDLFNRKDAEIERLNTAYEVVKQEYDDMFTANRNLMAEVERLKSDLEFYQKATHNLYKELTEREMKP